MSDTTGTTAGQPHGGPREWGHRFWDGTAGADETREAALETAARFKPGAVEIVHRAGPDAEWVRADYQPHVPSERLDHLAAHIASLTRLVDWRGHRLVELGERPNPPQDWRPIARAEDRVPLRTPTPSRTDRHFSPGYEGEIPDHHGVFETCAVPACVTSRRQPEAAGRLQDLTYEVLGDDARGGAR